MLIADLKSMAVGMGVSGASTMKKAQLVDAIRAAQPGASAPGAGAPTVSTRTRGERRGAGAAGQGGDEPSARADEAPASSRSGDEQPRTKQGSAQQDQPKQDQPQQDRAKQDQAAQDQAKQHQAGQDQPRQGRGDKQSGQKQEQRKARESQDEQSGDQPRQKSGEQGQGKQGGRGDQGKQSEGKQGGRNQQGNQPQGQSIQQDKQDKQAQQNQGQQQNQNQHDEDGDDEGGSRRSRRRRGRDRDRVTPRTGGRNEPDTTILEDDVLVPAAGILDVLDNYAFVRTSGYLPGTDDVYLSLSLVKKYGLRRGDAVVGQVRQPREGERREKFNPMVRIDSVNGAEPDASRTRPDFDELTPVHPDQRLRLESDPTELDGRVLDVVAPLGKGQRGVVVSAPRAGRTVLLGKVAAALTRNNPECHLMIVLVDARPEEVTDFQRAVKGEVVASTFDRPAGDHTLVAELAVERAKRLVEQGHDVVVLLDSMTALTRSYNQTVTPSGRTLAGGVDPAAVQASKRLLGAARNVEDGGSLTLLTTLTAGGSQTDEVILEELVGSANSEVHLSRELAERGVHPAVDVVRSSTRREDVLLGEQEAAILKGLRRSFAGTETLAATEKFLADLGRSRTNIEYLTGVAKTLA